ncbi:UDP-N-acetylmuramoylalanine--D-glutamate ligase [Thioalkalivibrio nitratireducens DSM 14787]|uniref:UDP-N-acetylmuramoylalanine--D-glutamate ligase n=1 Tax=Thioalkalivibrio nitratireducens (strain DSM 14787 / UNIQEM 213 / ALEN2) TaxID=1255043 RepID=L0DZ16_THIND|nr:UDP-N-acetylmuramoyl-L-alanine--D-glutamate ligase [Thioalkalivibrio nitratireducens]AGA34247.1 UDP-N-acetylmuramoylalanine--D-glutamate ligase [Thioalkalivibrio nitratireducens DSM 14787]
MMPTDLHSQRDILVVGLGATGLSVARYLADRDQTFEVTDTRPAPPGLDQLQRVSGGRGRWAGPLDSVDTVSRRRIVVSPGVPLARPELQRAAAAGVEIVGDVELFLRDASHPVVGITGSNGKSTVAALTVELLRALGHRVAIGGNFGPPALDLLAQDARLYVLELSSFQLETVRSPGLASAAILNISADHLDRYPDMDAYIAAKTRILGGAAHAVLNRDDPVLQGLATARESVSFGLGRPPGPADFGIVEAASGTWLARGSTPLIATAELALRGRHNWLNALAALALAWPWVTRTEPLLPVLRGFTGLPHRSQRVGRHAGVDYVDDSKGTNVGATLAAIRGVAGPLILIAGGQGKGQDFAPLAEALAGKARGVLLFGIDASRIEQALGGAVPVRRVGTMQEAVAAAAGWARPGDTVLLSPACASLDMFANYAERGECFAQAVRGLTS